TWVCRAGGLVSRIDPDARRVVRTIHVGIDCNDVAVGFGSVWVAGGDDDRVVRIDPSVPGQPEVLTPAAGARASTEPVLWVAAGAGSIWATQGDGLVRIDRHGNLVDRAVIPPAAGLAAGKDRVWVVTQREDSELLAFDRKGRRVGTSYPGGPMPYATSPAAA